MLCLLVVLVGNDAVETRCDNIKFLTYFVRMASRE